MLTEALKTAFELRHVWIAAIVIGAGCVILGLIISVAWPKKTTQKAPWLYPSTFIIVGMDGRWSGRAVGLNQVQMRRMDVAIGSQVTVHQNNIQFAAQVRHHEPEDPVADDEVLISAGLSRCLNYPKNCEIQITPGQPPRQQRDGGNPPAA